MADSIKIGLDQIVEIGENLIEPKNLICSICFCLCIDSHQCRNKKCQKMFCLECIKVAKLKFSNCPFCRLNIDFKKMDESVNLIYQKIKVVCLEENTCRGKYSIDEFIKSHSKNKNLKLLHCYLCKTSNKFLFKCKICSNTSCLTCEIMKLCFNCKVSICLVCIGNSQVLNKQEIICGICSSSCQNCNKKKIISEGKYICNLCNKIICDNCYVICDDCNLTLCKDSDNCFRSKREKCENCNNIQVSQLYNKCIHEVLKECNKCYVKCQVKSNENCSNIVISNNKCNKCLKDLCLRNCSIRCFKCKYINCKKCVKFCIQCKENFCSDCIKTCSSCNTFVSCLNCDIQTLKSCSICNELLCLNCWNICNYCSTIYCSKHSFSCISCEENSCDKHIINCKTCKEIRKEESELKFCMKNCTLKCSFCDISSNVKCNKSIHPIVSNLNCGHNVCTACIKYCSKCPDKVVKSCPTCIVGYYYHHCKLCLSYLCAVCSGFCNLCEELYCNNHICIYCKIFVKCQNCLIKSVYKCSDCDSILQIYEILKKDNLIICSLSCLEKFSYSKYVKYDKKCVNCSKNSQNNIVSNDKTQNIKQVYTNQHVPVNYTINQKKEVNRHKENKNKEKIGCVKSCVIY